MGLLIVVVVWAIMSAIVSSTDTSSLDKETLIIFRCIDRGYGLY